jgi:hypothetical protein
MKREVARYEAQIRQEHQDALKLASHKFSNVMRVNPDYSKEVINQRVNAGFSPEGLAETEPAKNWENLTDFNVKQYAVGDLGEIAFQKNPSLKNLNSNTTVNSAYFLPQSLGFDHALDVLREKLTTGEIKANQVPNLSVDGLFQMTAKYDKDLADKMNASRAAARAGLPVHKEYPEGYRWIELNKPGTFAAESEAMGHSVKGYEPPKGHPDWTEDSGNVGHESYGLGGWDAIKSGKAKVYSLVDSKGAPHATIEVKKGKPWNERNGIFYDNPELEPSWQQFSKEASLEEKAKGLNRPSNYIVRYPDWLKANDPELFEKHTHVFEQGAPHINQIKGKLNAAPKEEYQPYVQDFVKSGNWSDVGDFGNTGLYHVDKPEAIQKYGSPYLTQQEFDEFSPTLYGIPEKKEGGEIERPPIYHAESGVAPFGIRHSGEGVKGKGWFGVLPNQEGGISTEISAESNGHEYPLITPSLTKEQLNLLLSGEKPTPEIYKAAEDWANLRRGKGQSPFASPSDLRFALPKKMGGQINHDAMLVELLNKGKRYG